MEEGEYYAIETFGTTGRGYVLARSLARSFLFFFDFGEFKTAKTVTRDTRHGLHSVWSFSGPARHRDRTSNTKIS
jgi:hypothetical protein